MLLSDLLLVWCPVLWISLYGMLQIACFFSTHWHVSLYVSGAVVFHVLGSRFCSVVELSLQASTCCVWTLSNYNTILHLVMEGHADSCKWRQWMGEESWELQCFTFVIPPTASLGSIKTNVLPRAGNKMKIINNKIWAMVASSGEHLYTFRYFSVFLEVQKTTCSCFNFSFMTGLKFLLQHHFEMQW